LFAFLGFAGLILYEAYTLQLNAPHEALLQVCVLAMVLGWLCLFASYTQAMRQRMRTRRFALQAHQDTLRGMMRQLEDLASTDELTGLQLFAAVARACLRDGDVIARFGGEEFVLLLPNTDADQFSACCERLREAFSQAEALGVKVEGLSVSIGMTLLVEHDDLDDALQRADQALYQAKHDGRNRCVATWEPLSA
jgi:PleD family two-component response regulator